MPSFHSSWNALLGFLVFVQVVHGITYGAVNVPVADLRSQRTTLPCTYEMNDDQLTQLVFNELVVVLNDSTAEWLHVQVPYQLLFHNNAWSAYSGWIRADQVTTIPVAPSYSLVVTSTSAVIYKRACTPYGCLPEDIYTYVSAGTWLNGLGSAQSWWMVELPSSSGAKYGYILDSNVAPLHEEAAVPELRRKIVESGRTLLGYYYLWGGRSSFVPSLWQDKSQVTGVDCSGLVGLSYKVNGVITPRDANPMYLKSTNVTSPSLLQPGDLFFFTDAGRYPYVHHVMMYAGDNYILESNFDTQEGALNNNGTRMISLKAKYGVDNVADLRWGMTINPGGNILFWGSLLDDQNLKTSRISTFNPRKPFATSY